MEFKDILVHIDNSKQCPGRVVLAIRLAKKHRAHLTGLYAVTHPYYAPQNAALEHNVEQLKESFLANTAEADIQAEFICADWAVTGESIVSILNSYAHQKDLIIISQADQKQVQEHLPGDLPERIVLGSGRPVLVIPYVGTFDTVGERVLVAWKAGRASSRAVHDAMPFLNKAEQVIVVSVTSPADQPVPDTGLNAEIHTHLKRHHINVRVENLASGEVPVDSVLMNYAWEHGCDLLVMGVYAQSQRGSLSVGPVTKDFFKRMTVPILMSH